MAKVPPPPTQKSLSKGKPPEREATRANLQKPDPEKIVPLNFRVHAEFKKNFKIASATYGVTQSELLKQAFEAWKEKYG